MPRVLTVLALYLLLSDLGHMFTGTWTYRKLFNGPKYHFSFSETIHKCSYLSLWISGIILLLVCSWNVHKKYGGKSVIDTNSKSWVFISGMQQCQAANSWCLCNHFPTRTWNSGVSHSRFSRRHDCCEFTKDNILYINKNNLYI